MVINDEKAEKRSREYFYEVVIWEKVVREDLTEKRYLSKGRAAVKETMLQIVGGRA